MVTVLNRFLILLKVRSSKSDHMKHYSSFIDVTSNKLGIKSVTFLLSVDPHEKERNSVCRELFFLYLYFTCSGAEQEADSLSVYGLTNTKMRLLLFCPVDVSRTPMKKCLRVEEDTAQHG